MAIDHIDDIIECEKVFMDVVSETREINMFTYPVLTFSLLYKDGQFIDEEFARYASSHNMKWSDSNFFVSDNVGVLSNCPVSGDTNVVYWDAAEGKFDIATMRTLYGMKCDNPLFKIHVLNHGDVVECNINKYSVPIEYEIELANGVRVKTTANHLNRIYDGDDTRTDMLSLDDYLPFSAVPYTAPGSDYESGVNLEFKDGKAFGVNTGLNYQYYDGVDLRTLNHSPQFRRGALEGLALATSGKRNEIVTTSTFLRDSVTTLIASIGFLPMVGAESVGMVADSAEPVTRYHISWRKPSRENYEEGVYFCEGDSFWVRIKSIRKLNGDDKQSYCLSVIDRDADPVFMLANGLHTHNCRLLSDTTKLDAFINSIGGTALSVGSCRVSTINLVRIAYESGLDKEKYIQILKDRVLLDCKALTSMRHIIKRNIEKGLLPNFQDGALELDKMFCTIGGIGLYEVIDMFGLIETDELGCKSYSDDGVAFATRIIDTINEIKDGFECDYSLNLEFIPAENCAGVLCTADNLLYEQDKYFIYSNQWIPLMGKCTIQEKCRLGSLFDAKCGGGCIAHIDIENRFPTEEAAWDMLNYVASHGVIYFAFTTKISVCKNRHAFISEQRCPICGEPIADTYARVVGFYTPTSSYQKIRKREFDKRRWMNVLTNDGVMQ